MPRKSKESEVKQRVAKHLEELLIYPPSEMSINISRISEALNISRPTLYKYNLHKDIAEAAKRQKSMHPDDDDGPKPQKGLAKENALLRQKMNEMKTTYLEQIRQLQQKIILIEHNLFKFNIDTDELYYMPKPPDRSQPSRRVKG